MASTQTIVFCALFGFLWTISHGAGGDIDWQYATATFYNGKDPTRSMGNACGYGHVYSRCYGTNTAALSSDLFYYGLTCGSCFEIECDGDDKQCLNGSVTVTATNMFTLNDSIVVKDGGWVHPPFKQFDMAPPAFLRIAKNESALVPVRYRRVNCIREGRIQFTVIKGNSSSLFVLISNVGGTGDVAAVSIKGSNTNSWQPMTRRWGQIWQTKSSWNGQILSFEVKSSEGQTVVSNDVVPSNWKFGQTFEGGQF